MKKLVFIVLILVSNSCDSEWWSGTKVDFALGVKKEIIIKAAKILKAENPDLEVPDEKKAQWNDDENTIMFFYKEQKTFVSTKVSDKTISLLGICDYDQNFVRSINSDIKGKEKDAVLKEFERRILNPIKEILKR